MGILQVIADGAKLVSKEGLTRNGLILWLGPILTTSYCLIVVVLLWLDRQGMEYTLFPILVGALTALSHMGTTITGYLTDDSGPWSRLGAKRGLNMYLTYDLGILLVWCCILPTNSSSLTSIMNYSDRSGIMNVATSPLVYLMYFIFLLAESGRVPFDLAEAESELISGFNTEYKGLAYGIYAACEYTTMLVGITVITMVAFGSTNLIMLLGQGGIILTVIVNLRAASPRIRLVGATTLMWTGLVPGLIAHLSLITLTASLQN